VHCATVIVMAWTVSYEDSLSPVKDKQPDIIARPQVSYMYRGVASHGKLALLPTNQSAVKGITNIRVPREPKPTLSRLPALSTPIYPGQPSTLLQLTSQPK